MAVRDQASAEQLRLLWRVAGLAIMLSSCAAAGALLGWLWDNWRGTAPNGLTIGGAIGLLVGLVSFVRAAFQLAKLSSPSTRRASSDERQSNARHDHRS